MGPDPNHNNGGSFARDECPGLNQAYSDQSEGQARNPSCETGFGSKGIKPKIIPTASDYRLFRDIALSGAILTFIIGFAFPPGFHQSALLNVIGGVSFLLAPLLLFIGLALWS
jgi:hypothetical protein